MPTPENVVAGAPSVVPSFEIRNQGKPVLIPEIKVSGITAESARAGEAVKIWTRLSMTSYQALFDRIADHLVELISSAAKDSDVLLRMDRVSVVLLVIKPDHSAELWLDAAAVAIQAIAKRPIAAWSPVYSEDLADVTHMAFPDVVINKEDQVICLFRVDWRFAMLCDFNPDKDLSVEEMNRELGKLYRILRYRHLYDVIENDDIFSQLKGRGWFPFVEIVPREFRTLADACLANFDMDLVEANLVAAFDQARLQRMLDRWVAKPHFASKTLLLESAIKSFIALDPVPVLKIILTEIEGILREAYRLAHGSSAKTKELLEFAAKSAETKAGGSGTLLLPREFLEYLESYIFANFDPLNATGSAESRHAVSHGAAQAETYTMVKALQALLALDQFAFYT